MYEAFFSLSANPFSLTPDPHFLYLTPEHRDAISGLTYTVLARKGISVLTGDAGTGKTTLLRAMMRSIPADRAHFSFVLNPQLTADEFFRSALSPFGVTGDERDKGEILSVLEKHLLAAQKQNTSVVLVIDEAHRLSAALLEEIRLLANFETDNEKLLQVLLVGQDELDDLLDRHDLRQLKQRIGIRLRIEHLTEKQVGEYMHYRWSKVTTTPCPFDQDAAKAVWWFSQGVPRIVNTICDNALLHAFADGASTISAIAVIEVARELHLSGTPAPTATPAMHPVPAPGSETAADGKKQVRPLIGPIQETAPLASLDPYMRSRRWPFRLSIRQQRA